MAPHEKRAVLRHVNAFLRSDYHRVESLSDGVYLAQGLHACATSGTEAGQLPVFPLSKIDFDPSDEAARKRNADLIVAYASKLHGSKSLGMRLRPFPCEASDIASGRFRPCMLAFEWVTDVMESLRVGADYGAVEARNRACERALARSGHRAPATSAPRWAMNPNLTPSGSEAAESLATEWSEISRPTLSPPFGADPHGQPVPVGHGEISGAPGPAQQKHQAGGGTSHQHAPRRNSPKTRTRPPIDVPRPPRTKRNTEVADEATDLLGAQREAELQTLTASLAAEVDSLVTSVLRERAEVERLRIERDFYYERLRRIEVAAGSEEPVMDIIARSTKAFDPADD